MESNYIDLIKTKKSVGIENLYEYAALVSDLEFFSEQNPNLFKTADSINRYASLWNDLEVLNACALNDWEEQGKPKDFNNVWNKKYKEDATKLIEKVIDLLQKL